MAGLRSGCLLSHSLAKIPNLFHVMAAVDPVKLAPLVRGQRSQDRMVQEQRAPTEMIFAALDGFVHFYDQAVNLGDHIDTQCALRASAYRGFSSGRHISEAHH